MRTCAKCTAAKPEADFRFQGSRGRYASYCLLCEAAYKLDWQRRNVARRARYVAQDRARHPERFAAQDLRLRAERTSSEARRRAAKRATAVEYVDRMEIYRRDEGVCQLCEEPVTLSDYEMDHRIPLAKGGSHTSANCQTAHASCNRRKGATLPADLAVTTGRL